VEAKEVERNNGSFTESFSKGKRRRMFESHPPMTYAVDIDQSVFSEDGSEWVVVSKVYGRHFDRDDALPRIALAKVPTGEEKIIDPYDPEGEVSLQDFRTTKPKPVVLDAAPDYSNPKFNTIPTGSSSYENVLLQRVAVRTSLRQEQASRFLIVEKPKEGYFSKKDQLEISEAMWHQAGRDPREWKDLSQEDKLKLYHWNTSEHKNLLVKNNGKKVKLYSFTKQGEAYPAVEGSVDLQDIASYSL